MKFEEILLKVEKPARYSGGEYNTPDMAKPCDVRFCMCMPDLYEVGMSNLGLKILYHVLNNAEGVVAERCFAPAVDFCEQMRANNIALSSLETHTPLKDFDIVGFSIQYELLYSNVLYMLDVAGIPFYAKDRDDSFPLIIAGGPCAINPEPFAEFCDIVMVGEGEETLVQLAELYKLHKKKRNGFNKKSFLRSAAAIEGAYVPSINTPRSRKTVRKAVVKDFENCFYPTAQLMPTLEVVHDRAMLELYRGCANGCRFCQAGYYYRPIRYRSGAKAAELCSKLIKETGFDEISLGSLSTGDYPYLAELLDTVKPISDSAHVNLALPSLRLNSFKGAYATSSRKSSLTFAPEAGTQRLRDVINKNISEQDVEDGLKEAFADGYKSIKLYFMMGLPTETDEDIMGIVSLVKRIKQLYGKYGKGFLTINVSCAVFIPKPGTPFQWEPQITMEEMQRRQYMLKDELRQIRGVSFHYHDRETSELEAILARGDRRLSKVVELAYRKGAKFDGWTEFFKYPLWQEAMTELKIDKDYYLRGFSVSDTLPWGFIDIGVTQDYLKQEREKAYRRVTTENCLKGCRGCGASSYCKCNSFDTEVRQ